MNLDDKLRNFDLRQLPVVGLAIVAILPALLMWHLVSTNWVSIPLWDEWHTPGSQFASWCRGTLTLTEMFSQSNESRKFFPQLVYFTLAHFGGWDVRKEMRVVFILVCLLTPLCWELSFEKNVALLPVHHQSRVHLQRALEWMGPIPDNPDLALIFPYVDVLKERARVLEENHILRLPFVHDPLASEVLKSPLAADGAHGRLETSEFDSKGMIQVTGWAWLPERNRRADCVVIGCEDPAGVFKPLGVLETGVARPDLRAQMYNPRFYRAGFAHAVDPANILPGRVAIKGWAIDLRAQKAWPLALPAP